MRDLDPRLLDAPMLAVLAGISKARAELLLDGSKTDVESVRGRADPTVAARIGPLLRTLDVNHITVDELVVLGLKKEEARNLVEGGPYYFVEDAIRAAGTHAPEVADRLRAVLDVPDIRLAPDRALRPVRGPLLVRVDESESAAVRTKLMDLTNTVDSVGVARGEYLRIDPNDTETALATLGKLEGVDLVAPAFEDWEGVQRFLDPRYIVVLLASGTDPAAAEARARSLGLSVERQIPGDGTWILRLPSHAGLDVLTRVLAALAGLPEFKLAEPAWLPDNDLEAPLSTDAVDDADGFPWNLAAIGLPAAWSAGRGVGVEVVVIDTGIDLEHPAVVDRIAPRGPDDDWDFVSDADSSPNDEVGHGTAVASIVVGNGTYGLHGVAPGASLVPLRIPVIGSLDSYARRRQALLWAAGRATEGRVVVNCSWKTTGDVALIRDAIEQLATAGALVVASAGNGPTAPNEPHYPSDYPEVVSVAALDSAGQRAAYSFFGNKVDIAAPGGDGDGGLNQVRVAALNGGATSDFGTSMAAPHVAAAAALRWSTMPPGTTAAQVRKALEDGARDIGDPQIGRGALCLLSGVTIGDAPASEDLDSAVIAANVLDLDELVHDAGLGWFSARLTVGRRPHRILDDLRAITGINEIQIQRLAAIGALLVNDRPEVDPHVDGDCALKVDANSATVTELEALGIPTFTARLIQTRRPIEDGAILDQVLGLPPGARRCLLP